MKFGARILKTGIAISLALFIAQLCHSPSPSLAGISAIFAVQPSIYRSYLEILQRAQGNVIGAAIAIGFGLYIGNDFILIGIASILCVALLIQFKLENTIGLALVTLVIVMDSPNSDFLMVALTRFGTIMLGLVAAFIVNLIFLPPKYEVTLFQFIYSTNDEIMRWIKLNLRHAADFPLLKKDMKWMQKQITQMSSYYELYREERTFLRRTKISKSRKIAVYRQMILCSQKGYELLKILHRYENDFLQLPPDKQELIRRQIDYLTDTHEQLLLTYIDKVSVDLNYAEKHFSQDPKDLMKLFLNEMEEFDKVDEDVGIDQYHLMRIIACIFAYQETVDYLEKLMHSFKLRHNEENKIDIDVHES
ncbi:aromatic acid exporter family protein [Listeria grandensis]|uniref:Aromatic acid exporter family protein n=2 Tax=Listeria grandensis TaxID=1494963 RepID=A0A7X0Y549_9LIST|nr:aromatic acid exporter family protein [Listeria grandensis]MBC1475376.1 aromatic acid exporter family protein [Listeria grandensis]MBC1936754.1 aromatic acid exporter family protein [Listeria grandensis]MBC6316479.1 aromatic acid exporter family protein [Listeria grandensis]